MPTPRRPKKAFIQAVVAGVIALGLGGVAIVLFFLVITAMQGQQQQTAEELQTQLEAQQKQHEAELAKLKKSDLTPKTFTEVQAAVEIPMGTLIEESMLKEVEVAGGRPTLESFRRSSNLIGKVANADLLSGEVITKKKLLDTDGMLSVPEGKRAISLQISSVGMVNGAITPGAYVDVLATVGDSDPVTKTLIQNVRVITVGTGNAVGRATGVSGSSMAVTIEVTPEEAEVIALANKEGDFHLALRGFGDKQTEQLYGSDLGQLISGIRRDELEKDGTLSPPDGVNLPNEIPVNYTGNPAALPEPAIPEPTAQAFKMEIYKGATPESKEFEWRY